MPGSKHVIVIGAGLSGLACAYRLNQLGAEVTVLEASERAGGLLGTILKDGFLFESGAQSFQTTEVLVGLIRELGIESELQKADPNAARYSLFHGRLQKIPTSPQAMLTSSLLGAGSRWRLLSDVYKRQDDQVQLGFSYRFNRTLYSSVGVVGLRSKLVLVFGQTKKNYGGDSQTRDFAAFFDDLIH